SDGEWEQLPVPPGPVRAGRRACQDPGGPGPLAGSAAPAAPREPGQGRRGGGAGQGAPGGGRQDDVRGRISRQVRVRMTGMIEVDTGDEMTTRIVAVGVAVSRAAEELKVAAERLLAEEEQVKQA